MSAPVLRIRTDQTCHDALACLSLRLEREIYTPYESLQGVFLTDENADDCAATQIELWWEGACIFLGIADHVEKIRQNGVWLLRVQSRTFTSLLTQNELEPGLHTNLTLQSLISGFYTIPHVTAEANAQTGYVFVKDGTSLWDCVGVFVYKLANRYPFVRNNQVCFTLDPDAAVHAPTGIVTAGEVLDSTRLISHIHMEDTDGTPNVYQEENLAARALQIVRHKQIGFDKQFVMNPGYALTYRNKFSCRGMRAQYVTYAGFGNEQLGEKVSCGQLLQEKTICRVRLTFGSQGLRTSLWAYEDGFYNQTP